MDEMVRDYVQDDSQAIVQLYREVGSWFEDIEMTPELITSSAARPDFKFFVADDADGVMGFVGCLYFEAVGRAELGPIAVASKKQGLGVGRALIRRMLAYLLGQGIKRVHIMTKSTNTPGISFFMKNGFCHEAYLRDYTLNGEDAVRMVIRL
jgi:ribosomal protein S18 acetylase RimI-like enzyme